jgi:hypothetical protein
MMCGCGKESTTTHVCPMLAGPLCLCGQPQNQTHVCPAASNRVLYTPTAPSASLGGSAQPQIVRITSRFPLWMHAT